MYLWRSSGRGRRRRPAELLLPLPPRLACRHPAQMVSLQVFVPAINRLLTFDPSAAESEEALLKMSVSQPESSAAVLPDFSSMTEEEQIAYAMQMSLAGGGKSCFGSA